MSSSGEVAFGYQIRPEAGGWAWVAYDLHGRVQGRGWAAEKAVAAAFVIRHLVIERARAA